MPSSQSLPPSRSPSLALPQVSFIVPTYNCLALTQAMLASLQATVPPGLAYEIVVVDDGSTDGTREWLATLQLPGLRVLLNERNLGYARANNHAARHARGEFLVLLNDDLVLTSHWFEPMLDAHRALGARAGAIGNVQLDARSGAVDHAGIVISQQGKPEHARALPPWWRRVRQRVRIVPAVTGASLLLARPLWEQLGGFDETYVNGGEDIDLCFRARALGRVNAVALRSVIRHHVSSSPGRKLRDEENSYRLARRWRPEFLAASGDGIRAWCRDYFERFLPEPRDADLWLMCRAWFHAAGWTRKPPPEARAAVEAGLAREFARWEKMFGQ